MDYDSRRIIIGLKECAGTTMGNPKILRARKFTINSGGKEVIYFLNQNCGIEETETTLHGMTIQGDHITIYKNWIITDQPVGIVIIEYNVTDYKNAVTFLSPKYKKYIETYYFVIPDSCSYELVNKYVSGNIPEYACMFCKTERQEPNELE
jgi:hypothetical protein